MTFLQKSFTIGLDREIWTQTGHGFIRLILLGMGFCLVWQLVCGFNLCCNVRMGISFCHSCRTMTEGGLDDTKIDILVNQLRGIGMPAGVGAEILHSTFLQEGFIMDLEVYLPLISRPDAPTPGRDFLLKLVV